MTCKYRYWIYSTGRSLALELFLVLAPMWHLVHLPLRWYLLLEELVRKVAHKRLFVLLREIHVRFKTFPYIVIQLNLFRLIIRAKVNACLESVVFTLLTSEIAINWITFSFLVV